MLCQTGEQGLTLQSSPGEMFIRYREAGGRPAAAIAFRADVLAGFEGRSDEIVQLETVASGKGRARWQDRGMARELDFEAVEPERVPAFPDVPRRLAALPATLLPALAEAAAVTAREAVRFALKHGQLRGRTGEVIATDGKQLLVQGGFPFPWKDDVLVPCVSALGCPELATEEKIGVGRTPNHVVLLTGRWNFLLGINTTGRYPDIATVMPRPSATPSRLWIQPEDATFLAATLPKLPGRDYEHAPITLDLGTAVAVRGRDGDKGPPTEVVLSRSSASGPPIRLCSDRAYLLRALKLGFREFHIGSDVPVLCRDGQRVFLWVPLSAQAAIPPSADAVRIVSADGAAPSPTPVPERSKTPMPTPQPNGHKTPSPETANTQPERWGLAEVIAETEALRGLLQDALARTTRLQTALKQQHRQTRAVRAAVASLRELQLGP